MSLLGPAAQRPGREHAKGHIVSSGPADLSIQRLSAFQWELIDMIDRLRSKCWLDRQIAEHVNAIVWLTQRDHYWLSTGVFSVGKKYAKRL